MVASISSARAHSPLGEEGQVLANSVDGFRKSRFLAAHESDIEPAAAKTWAQPCPSSRADDGYSLYVFYFFTMHPASVYIPELRRS